MLTMIGHLRAAAARLTPGRAAVVAMLLGPVVGAMLAFGTVAAQDANVVTIDNFTFGPKELTVAVGTAVKWVNHDDIPHTVVNAEKGILECELLVGT
jgi:plastocyanin